MNMSVKFTEKSKSKHLSAEQMAAFGQQVDAIRREIMDSIGEQDAQYIYKIRNFVRYSEIASRGMLMFGGWIPPIWLLGTGLLGISKIVENMELGHNVMHGQFDWLNDPSLNGANYDWIPWPQAMIGNIRIIISTIPIPILSAKTTMLAMACCVSASRKNGNRAFYSIFLEPFN
jgi:hypothetical protein